MTIGLIDIEWVQHSVIINITSVSVLFIVMFHLSMSECQVFVDNFVHGDLHPGNILVQHRGSSVGSSGSAGVPGEPQGKATLTDLWDTVVVSVRPDPSPLQLVLLDAGIVAQLSDHDLANFKAVFTAVVKRQVRIKRLHTALHTV